MYAANHWRRSVKESFQNRLFIKALSSLEKLVIHLLLHDSLHGGKIGYFLAFLSEFSTCVLAHFFLGPFSNTVDSRKGELLDGAPMELSLNTSAGPCLMGLGLRSGWTHMLGRKIDWLMGLGLRSGWTAVTAGKIDSLMGLGSKSKCAVSSGKLNYGTSGNSLSIYQHLLEFPHRCQFHFPARIVDTDLFHSSLNHFQQTPEKRKQST